VKYVLDANIVIAGLNGVASVQSRLAGVAPSDVGIPIVALAELTFGAYKSKRRDDNLLGLLRFAARSRFFRSRRRSPSVTDRSERSWSGGVS
jgi:predicted nucleic acid-binding protein